MVHAVDKLQLQSPLAVELAEERRRTHKWAGVASETCRRRRKLLDRCGRVSFGRMHGGGDRAHTNRQPAFGKELFQQARSQRQPDHCHRQLHQPRQWWRAVERRTQPIRHVAARLCQIPVSGPIVARRLATSRVRDGVIQAAKIQAVFELRHWLLPFARLRTAGGPGATALPFLRGTQTCCHHMTNNSRPLRRRTIKLSSDGAPESDQSQK